MAEMPNTIVISVRDVPEVQKVMEATGAALGHLMRRLQDDPRLAYLIGPGSQTYDLVTEAIALASGQAVDEVRAKFEADITTSAGHLLVECGIEGLTLRNGDGLRVNLVDNTVHVFRDDDAPALLRGQIPARVTWRQGAA